MMCDYAFFSMDPSQRDEAYQSMGMSQHLPYSGAIPHHPSDPTIALFPHLLTGMG